jgi:hypothetical protein
MEEEVEKCLDEAISSPDVVAALAVDIDGLPLGKRGAVAASPSVSGAVVVLADSASSVEDDPHPVITIDCTSSKMMVHREGKVTSLVVTKAGQRGSEMIVAGGESSINVD